MAIILTDADTYFNTYVLNNDEWVNAATDKKNRALQQAQAQLYSIYQKYSLDATTNKPLLPDKAVFEQALWLLRIDDSIRRSEQGVRAISVNGITITLDKAYKTVAPEVIEILGRRIGRYTSDGRQGWTLNDSVIRTLDRWRK